MIQKLIRASLFIVFISGCTSISSTPDTRSQQEKKADFNLAIAGLSGEFDVVESRNEIYLRHNFAEARTLKVAELNENIIFMLVGKDSKELVIVGGMCGGNNHKLSTNLSCSKASSGIDYISFSNEKHEYQIKSGAMIGGFPPLNIRTGDFLLSFFESGSGKPHYYTLKRK